MATLYSINRELKRGDSVDTFIQRRIKPGAPRHDSVVVAGNGIGALTFAATLARDPRMEGRVTVVAPPIEESRRLINGVSMRGLAADFLCHALGVDHDEFLDAVGTPGRRPVAHAQTVSFAEKERDGSYSFTPPGAWQGVMNTSNELLWGVRNSRVTAGMTEFMQGLGIKWVEERATGLDHLRDLALGKNALVANGTTNPSLLGAAASSPRIRVLAVQAPMLEREGGVRQPLGYNNAFAPLINRDGTIDVGYFTPFADPLSPRSTWYGIFARLVDADASYDKERELDIMQEQLFGVAEGLGLEIDDPSETMARALVPASSFGKVPPSPSGTLELRRAYAGGAPCYYADGILSSAIGGVVAAQAVLNGADADRLVRSSLKQVRWVNYLFHLQCMRFPGLVDWAGRRNVSVAMAYPHAMGVGLWASRRSA